MLDIKLQQSLIAQGRAFTRGYRDDDPNMADFESDQELRYPQPPLVKAPVSDAADRIALPTDFSTLTLDVNLGDLFYTRKSSRKFTGGAMTLLQLSFLLWSTQGIKKLRGKGYATIRTVPCGGARHEFETYLVVNAVDGLSPGVYHYLPMENKIECIGKHPGDAALSEMLSGQGWGTKANVVFFWSMVPYRAEWRYGIYAHRTALIDTGHIGQNLYLSATALHLGACGIAAFSHEACNRVFSLDGEEEYVVYCAPVGTISYKDAEAEERETYHFVYADTDAQ